MALGRKGLTCVLCVFHCQHTALFGYAMQSHTKQCAGADGRDLCCLYTGLC
ncbi:unnamed protein product, partial [Staurois parvus]